MQNTGPLRIGGISYPLASIETPLSDAWRDESRYVTVRTGGQRRRVRIERRYRPRWRVAWRGLTRGEALALRSDLTTAPTLTFVPRTRLDGDLLDEEVYEVRVVSPITTLEPLWRDAQGLWGFDLELESLRAYDTMPQLSPTVPPAELEILATDWTASYGYYQVTLRDATSLSLGDAVSTPGGFAGRVTRIAGNQVGLEETQVVDPLMSPSSSQGTVVADPASYALGGVTVSGNLNNTQRWDHAQALPVNHRVWVLYRFGVNATQALWQQRHGSGIFKRRSYLDDSITSSGGNVGTMDEMGPLDLGDGWRLIAWSNASFGATNQSDLTLRDNGATIQLALYGAAAGAGVAPQVGEVMTVV